MSKIRIHLQRSMCAAFLAAGLGWAQPPESQINKKADFVVIGDSLAAGFQNFSLVDVQQVHSFANLIGQQWNKPLVLPLVPCPGLGSDLYLKSLGPPPELGVVGGMLPLIPRDNPLQAITNLAVPGQTVTDALSKTPGPVQSIIDGLTNVVLGFPTPFLTPGPARSQVQLATALNPKNLLVWVGSNDALLAALTGDFTQLTPLNKFAASYTGMMQTLHSQTNANVVTANVPDVTQAPFFTPVAALGAGAAAALHLSTSDFLRPGALGPALQILSTPPHKGYLPADGCPDTTRLSSTGKSPCVLTAAQAMTIQNAVFAFNAVIAMDSAIYGATLVDMNAFITQLYNNGYQINNGPYLTRQYLGGLVTLDGVHPTNTLHAIIANEFIRVMNAQMNTGIPSIAVDQVAQTDPLISPAAALASHACQ